MAEKTLDDMFLVAEKQFLKALPKMARAAQSPEGKAAFLKHKDEARWNAFSKCLRLSAPARGKTCEAIQGIIAEKEEIIVQGSVAFDAALISSDQAVEHYEIAHYGTLKSWGATRLHRRRGTFDANLPKELATDQKLRQLGEASANLRVR